MLLCAMDKFVLIISFLITPAFGAMCSGSRLTDSDRQLILNAHNTRRSNLAKGLEPTRGGGRAPPSSQMYKMSYDCALEAQAQAYAQQCRIGVHSGGRYGENLYWSSAGGPASTHLQTAASMWWGELAQYGISDPQNILTMGVFNTGVGHFTQMAWWRTTKVGCGVANCNYNGYSGSTQVVCQYLEQGNYINQVIYPVGSPCTSNSQCTAIAGSICSVSEGLCVDPLAQAGGTGTGGVVPPPSGTCYDIANNCVENVRLCQDGNYRQIMQQQCQKTCGYCTGGNQNVPTGSCVDVAPNCAQNVRLCNDYTYRSLMSQQCRRTCGQC